MGLDALGERLDRHAHRPHFPRVVDLAVELLQQRFRDALGLEDEEHGAGLRADGLRVVGGDQHVLVLDDLGDLEGHVLVDVLEDGLVRALRRLGVKEVEDLDDVGDGD